MSFSFKDFYIGKRPLKTESDLIHILAKRLKTSPEEVVKRLYLYKTPNKQSLIVRIGDKIAKVYDSKDLDRPVINWITDVANLKNDIGNVEIVSHSKIRFPNKKERVYLFDKNLFLNQSVTDQIREML